MDDFRQSNSAEDEIEWFSDLWIDQMNYMEICNHSNIVIVHCKKLRSWEFLLFHSDKCHSATQRNSLKISQVCGAKGWACWQDWSRVCPSRYGQLPPPPLKSRWYVGDFQVACHYEEVGAKMRKMVFAESQEEREILVHINNKFYSHALIYL